MKPKKMAQKQSQTGRAAPAQRPETKSPAGRASDPSPEGLSVYALIKGLRGSLKGGTSLVAALKRERRNDDKARTRKFAATGED